MFVLCIFVLRIVFGNFFSFYTVIGGATVDAGRFFPFAFVYFVFVWIRYKNRLNCTLICVDFLFVLPFAFLNKLYTESLRHPVCFQRNLLCVSVAFILLLLFFHTKFIWSACEVLNFDLIVFRFFFVLSMESSRICSTVSICNMYHIVQYDLVNVIHCVGDRWWFHHFFSVFVTISSCLNNY